MKLSEEGFLLNYLISGTKTERFYDNHSDKNQLRYELYLRSIVFKEGEKTPSKEIRLGENSRLGQPWEYYYNHANWFVDKSRFYDLLEHVELRAVSYVKVPKEMELSAILWTFGGTEIWLDSEKILTVEEPVYKPIRRVPFTFSCKEGIHEIYIRFQNLGVRDTRNVFGIQFTEGREHIEVEFPKEKNCENAMALGNWMNGVTLKKGHLHFAAPAPMAGQVICRQSSFDRARNKEEILFFSKADQEIELPSGYEDIYITIGDSKERLDRKFNRLDQLLPVYAQTENPVDYCLTDLAESKELFRPLYNVLARYGKGTVRPEDEGEIFRTFELIESRMDCSDFLMAVLLRLIKTYELPKEIMDKVKTVLLNYRYWMDQQGSDGMCFWSENHALTFYGCQMIAGALYPEEFFIRANMTGKQMEEEGIVKVTQWLNDIKRDGLEEFLSSGYTAVTLGALLNIVDFGTEEISVQASHILDEMFLQIARHTFHGSVIAPQGRVYREVLSPFRTSTQAVLYLIDSNLPYEASEWLAFLGSTKYEIPLWVKKEFHQFQDLTYFSGNAEIKLYKTKEYAVTSVTSTKEKQRNNWEFLDVEKSDDVADFIYVKSMNEKYHGTTRFAPGIYGYQQHLFYCALDNQCFVFANMPGGSADASSQRPGYWYGNAILPAMYQEKNRIGCIFQIDQSHPISFTHVFFPTLRFEETKIEEHWLFGKKGEGYVAIWCNTDLVPYNDQLEDCEFRAYQKETAYFAVCMSQEECKDFQDFCNKAKGMEPYYENNILRASGGYELLYDACEDTTQYI